MASRSFVIQEKRTDGGEPEYFEWTGDAPAVNSVAGGRRACPTGLLNDPGAMRKERTDYPGAATPSFQILGPMEMPREFSGEWDDRYNFPGYALQERRRFKEMCRRGNPVKIQFETIAHEGFITEWDLPYRKESKIQYKFTFDPSNQTDVAEGPAAPKTARSAQKCVDDVGVAYQQLLEFSKTCPRGSLGRELADTLDAALLKIDAAHDALIATLDGSNGPLQQFKRAATQMRQISAAASEMIDALVTVRSDASLAVRTAISVLDFESWARSLTFQGRVLIGKGNDGARALEQRETPPATKMYRPKKGESLYAIANRFYGDPGAWRLIADANNLHEINLAGNELLVIPERGRG